MVRDIFDANAIAGLKGWMGVGHGQSGLPAERLDVKLTPC